MSEFVDSWDYAIEHGGFYFERAKYFGLPLPPKCFVDKKDDDLTKEDIIEIGKYHYLFREAEADEITRYIDDCY